MEHPHGQLYCVVLYVCIYVCIHGGGANAKVWGSGKGVGMGKDAYTYTIHNDVWGRGRGGGALEAMETALKKAPKVTRRMQGAEGRPAPRMAVAG